MIVFTDIINKAQTTWLKIEEIEFLLDTFISPLTVREKLPDTPPGSGALLLIDRNRNYSRSYKEDGYSWVKNKKGTRIREDHVKLKLKGKPRVGAHHFRSASTKTLFKRAYFLLDPETGGTLHEVITSKRSNAQKPQSLMLIHYLDEKENHDNFESSTSIPFSLKRKSNQSSMTYKNSRAKNDNDVVPTNTTLPSVHLKKKLEQIVEPMKEQQNHITNKHGGESQPCECISNTSTSYLYHRNPGLSMFIPPCFDEGNIHCDMSYKIAQLCEQLPTADVLCNVIRLM